MAQQTKSAPKTGVQTSKRGSKKRQSVRLDIAAPFELYRINLPAGKDRPPVDHIKVRGVLLNISGSGVLGAVDAELPVDSYVVLTFELNGMEKIERILGKVKRVEKVEHSEYITGFEFIHPVEFLELISEGDREIYDSEIRGFDDTVQKMIAKYVIRNRDKDEI
ncbi:MAG: hypothetical protein GF307_07410 [candidate division Zixibacteria bacterium]|nr:hypothetical protein [candidate division Zixibacteria bacterium]